VTLALCSELDRLSVNDCSENFSVFDRLMPVSVQVECLSIHVDREEVSFFVSLNECLLVSLLLDFANLDSLFSEVSLQGHVLAILMQLDESHGA